MKSSRQGALSALGPLLWNIFQNDSHLVYEIEQNLSMYDDDYQLFEIRWLMTTNDNASAKKASLWYESNLLKGNLSKYHTMLINNKQRDSRDDKHKCTRNWHWISG